MVLLLAGACSGGRTGDRGTSAHDPGDVPVPDAGNAGGDAPGGTQSDGGEPTTPAWRAAYHVVDLGTHGGRQSNVVAMSPNGLVLVASDNANWVYDLSTGAIRDVPMGAAAINSRGFTAGLRGTGAKDAAGLCDDFEVALYAPDGSVTHLGNPVNGDYGGLDCQSRDTRKVAALDDRGAVAVEWDASNGRYHVTNAYLWNGTWQRLPGYGGDMQAVRSALGGKVVGESTTQRDANFQYELRAVLWQDGTVNDLGNLGGWSCANGINAKGQIVGHSEGKDDTALRAFLWDAGTMTDLGTLPGTNSSNAMSINSRGQIVGTSLRPLLFERAVLFADGTVYDLNDLVDAHDLLLVEARAIADNGMIAVNSSGSARHAVVLIPTGEPLVPDRSWRASGTVIASGEMATSLALDASNVYWMALDGRHLAIKAAPKTGGSATTLFRTDAGWSYGNLLVDDRFVWFDMLSPCTGAVCTGTEGIWRVPKSGGVAAKIVEGSHQFAMSDTTIYSARASDSLTDNQLIATPKDGGVPVALATAEFDCCVSGLAADGETVFFVKDVEISGAGTFIVPVLSAVSGSTVSELTAPFAPNFSGGWLELDAAAVYVRSPYSVLRIPRSGGPAVVLATISGGPSSSYASDFDLHGGFAYWTEGQRLGQPACVKRVAVTGGTATCIDSSYFQYASVRADDTSVFFIRDTEIVRIAK